MLRKITFLLSASALTAANMPAISIDRSLPCQVHPISTFAAGDRLQFQFLGSTERSCRVAIAFSDPRFLPVSLLAVPGDCSGYQTASLRLPESLADGYASIQWQCVDEFTTSCSVLNIVGGCNDPEAFASERQGMRMRMECHEDDSRSQKRESGSGSRNLLQTLHLNSTMA